MVPRVAWGKHSPVQWKWNVSYLWNLSVSSSHIKTVKSMKLIVKHSNPVYPKYYFNMWP